MGQRLRKGRPACRALLSCPRPAVSWRAAVGTCCFGSQAPVSISSCFPSQPLFWRCQRWARSGRTRPSRRRPATSGLCSAGPWQRSPVLDERPPAQLFRPGPLRGSGRRSRLGPTSRRCLSTRDNLSTCISLSRPPKSPHT